MSNMPTSRLITAPAPVSIRPVVAVSIAVFRDDGHVLIATRTKPPADGAWSLPGGRLEMGETLGAGALRELHEEVDIKAELIGFNRHVESIGHDSHGNLTHHFVVASFVGRWIGGEAKPGPEAGAVRWVMPGALAGLAITHGLGDVLRSAQSIWENAR